ncbi:hypothetical protein [Treponema sp. R80B11-R83G3]
MKNLKTNLGSFASAKLQAKMRSILAVIALVVIIGFSMAACGDDDGGGGGGGGENWKKATQDIFTRPQNYLGSVAVTSIAYGNNTFVAVGYGQDGGKIATSTDGVNWKAVADTKFTTAIISIGYGNGTFVAGGDYGKMAYSSDNGATWTAVEDSTFGSNTNSSINAIAYGNSTFVAVGRVGIAYSTNNGATWTKVEDNNLPYYKNAIAFGNGMFVAVGLDTTYPDGETVYVGKIVTSTDGIDWTAVGDSTFGETEIRAITFGNGTFVAGGYDNVSDRVSKVAISTDGTNWTAVTQNAIVSISAIAYGNNKFIAAGGDKVYTKGGMAASANGTKWTAITLGSEFNGPNIGTIAFGNGTFVAGGGTSLYYSK